MTEQCMGNGWAKCTKDAEYLRFTQFAGTHPLCEEHAKEDDKFMVNDSYTGWKKLDLEQ